MKAYLTVDLGFGDSGKGSIVDYLVREYNADLVVRYSGGPQCGHNVVLPDGTHHCFAQFGAGSLAGVPSYLDRNVIVDPLAMKREHDHLSKICTPSLTVHPSCLITTPYHQITNKEKERSRGNNRHGSCGMGVGETRNYWLRYGRDALTVNDLLDQHVAVEKLELIRQRLLADFPNELCYRIQPEEVYQALDEFREYRVSEFKPHHTVAVFEAAQGVLLDETFGFHPYTTWSTVTEAHADLSFYQEIERIGIIRAYHTRHGAGPLPTYDEGLTKYVGDLHNPHNEWQGSFRAGWLDLRLLEYALRVNPVDYLAVTCIDQLPEKSYVSYRYDNWIYEDCLEPSGFPSLAGQEAICKKLEHVIPQLIAESPLDKISELCKIGIESYGPSHADKVSKISRTFQHHINS